MSASLRERLATTMLQEEIRHELQELLIQRGFSPEEAQEGVKLLTEGIQKGPVESGLPQAGGN